MVEALYSQKGRKTTVNQYIKTSINQYIYQSFFIETVEEKLEIEGFKQCY